ncbi:hypothetical protein [Leptospira kanakyensis]|uniref:hypothetical protein n=1 Tax=Leptospira kanakyensis TaxID=2484968 RepID=UPI00223E73EE|nr:hypothetical protein [Leptospira kanakyensis]MCW7471729.1 hypothetical protein [Leptospira kanakyensis]
MKYPLLSSKRKSQLSHSAFIYNLQRRFRKLFKKITPFRNFREAYRIPKNNSIDLLVYEFMDLFLLSDLPLIAKSIANLCEQYNKYGHVRKNEIESKVLSFSDRFESNQWSYIDSFSPDDFSKVNSVRIEILSQFDSFIIVKFSFTVNNSSQVELEKILRQPVRNNILFFKPKLKYLLKLRFFAYTVLSETEILSDRIRRLISKERFQIQKKFLKRIPKGLLFNLTGNWIECNAIGLVAEDEDISNKGSAFYKDIFPFKSRNYEVFRDKEKSKVFSLPDETWDKKSASAYFLILRSNRNSILPPGILNIVHYKSHEVEKWHNLPILCVKNFLIYTYQKNISEHRTRIQKLRSTNFFWRIFAYYKFQKSFQSKFRYFDEMLSEIFVKNKSILWGESDLHNYYDQSLDNVIEKKTKYYSQIFSNHFQKINNDVKITIQETTQTLLLILTVIAVFLAIIQIIIAIDIPKKLESKTAPNSDLPLRIGTSPRSGYAKFPSCHSPCLRKLHASP